MNYNAGFYNIYVFDFDDTLVQSFNHVMNYIYPLVAEEEKLHFLGREVAIKHWGSELHSFFHNVFVGDFDTPILLKKMIEIQRSTPPPPYKESKEIIETLIDNGKFVCIYTSGLRSMIENTIVNSLFMKPTDFPLIFSTPEYNTKKPTQLVVTEIRKKYLMLMGIEPHINEMVFIGDSTSDYITAKECGADFFGLTSGVHQRKSFIELGLAEDFIFEDICLAKEAILRSARTNTCQAVVKI
jgi:phosphoglycolate phosphatase-like HAD superfamily hydrolase